jgi:hypothetical protein
VDGDAVRRRGAVRETAGFIVRDVLNPDDSRGRMAGPGRRLSR